MEKVRIGVLGAYRGTGMINYCKAAQNAEVVAICDKWTEGLERQKEQNVGLDITYYDNFEDFIRHDMDAVVLANYANEHAPFAIRALKEGKHVFSEVLPAQTMKEAVELIETVESSGLVYAYGENYCYMPAPYEMKKLYEENVLGELEYAECEYLHNCESIWPSIAYGDKNHWRNNMYSTFYCTHSLGPIIHATGLRPVSVIGIEGTQNARCLRVGRKSGSYGMELVTLENGGVIKSLHGGLYKNSIWYSINGSKGRAESAREDALLGDVHHLYLNVDGYDGEYNHNLPTAYKDGKNEEARIEMSIASLEAGIAFNNASVTLIHGMSRPIGALFHIAHGMSNAILMNVCLRFAVSGAYDRFGQLGREIGVATAADDDKTAAEKFLDALDALTAELQAPTLVDAGVDKDEFFGLIDKMAHDAMVSGSPQNTMRDMTEEDVKELYKQLW